MEPKMKEKQLKAKSKPGFDERRTDYQTKFRLSEKGRASKKAYHSRPEVKARAKDGQRKNMNIIVRSSLDRGKKDGKHSDIDNAWFYQTLESQHQCCHYCETKLKLEIKSRLFNQPSIDRKDSSIGYTKENSVISCLFCNYCKNLTDHDVFVDFLDSLRSGILHERFVNHLCIPPVPGNMRKGIAASDRKKELSNTIKIDEVKNMMAKQDGKCAITGISFQNSTTAYYPLKPSIDRIDSKSDHRPENCQIVLMAINLAKNNNDNEDLKKYLDEMRDTYWIGLRGMTVI